MNEDERLKDIRDKWSSTGDDRDFLLSHIDKLNDAKEGKKVAFNLVRTACKTVAQGIVYGQNLVHPIRRE